MQEVQVGATPARSGLQAAFHVIDPTCLGRTPAHLRHTSIRITTMRPDPHKQAASRKYQNNVRSRGGGTAGATDGAKAGSGNHRGGGGGARGGRGGRGGYHGGRDKQDEEEDTGDSGMDKL